MTHRAADGTPVVGLVMPGVTYANVIDIARAWGGAFVTPDCRCVADQPRMLNATRMLRELFVAGAFPRNFAAISAEDVNSRMQQGSGALALAEMARNRICNDPQCGRHPGRIETMAVPISETLRDRFAVVPAKVEFWGMAISRNSRRKDVAWQVIRSAPTREATLVTALNGAAAPAPKPRRRQSFLHPTLAVSARVGKEQGR